MEVETPTVNELAKYEELSLHDKVKDRLSHNSVHEACDLLLEAKELSYLQDLPELDEQNFRKLCLYLIRTSSYMIDYEDLTEVLTVVYNIFIRFKCYPDALRVALRLNSKNMIEDIFNMVDDATMKKQLCFLLGRQSYFSYITEDDELNQLIGNLNRSKYFLSLGKDLDVLELKTPSDIYKSHLGDTGSTAYNADGVEVVSAKQNEASAYVNGFVNLGFCNDKFISDHNYQYIFKCRDYGQLASAASIGMCYQWNPDEGYSRLESLLNSDSGHIQAGAILGIGLLNAGTYNSEYQTCYGLLYDKIHSNIPLSNRDLIIDSSLLSMGIAYAGSFYDSAFDTLREYLDGERLSDSYKSSCIAALSLGITFVGSRNEDAVNAIVTKLMMTEVSQLEQPITLLLCLGLGLLFLNTQEYSQAILEVCSTFDESVSQIAALVVETCAYAGSGNVLQVQKLLHICAEHLTEKANHQMVAVIGLALISFGESIGKEMVLRTMTHLLQYCETPIKRAVPLAIGLLYASDPEFSIIEMVSRLTHDSDDEICYNSILSLGLIGLGTNNSKIAGLLRQLNVYYAKDEKKLFLVRISQGLLHMGKGLVTINPLHSDFFLYNPVSISSLLAVIYGCLCSGSTIFMDLPHILFFIAPGVMPRMLMFLDENLENKGINIRVGQAVEIVGQAGDPRPISGFQTHVSPVLLNSNERGEIVESEIYQPYSEVLEDCVILREKEAKTEEKK